MLEAWAMVRCCRTARLTFNEDSRPHDDMHVGPGRRMYVQNVLSVDCARFVDVPMSNVFGQGFARVREF